MYVFGQRRFWSIRFKALCLRFGLWPGHLTDKDLLQFLMRAKESLRPNGVIIMKDNMARQGCRLDPVDSSLIRHLDIMKSIILKAGLTILDTQKQEGFPDIIVPVWMIAMQ